MDLFYFRFWDRFMILLQVLLLFSLLLFYCQVITYVNFYKGIVTIDIIIFRLFICQILAELIEKDDTQRVMRK